MRFSFDEAEFCLLAEQRLLRTAPHGASSVCRPACYGDDSRHDRRVPRGDMKLAAVLVPVIARREGLSVLLTRRSDDLASHAGQVAFPGGKVDTSDNGPADAALREAREETGLARRFVDVKGFLDVYETGTGFRIVPVVGLVQPGFALRAEPGEVAEIFEAPLAFLMDRANHRREEIFWRGRMRGYYAMYHGAHHIWGATAGILRVLSETMYDTPPVQSS